MKRRMMVVMAAAALVISLGAAMMVLAAADLTDDTVAQFSSGTVGSCFVSPSRDDGNPDGEVILIPAYFEPFNSLTGWNSQAWQAGGSVTASGGQIIVDNAVGYTAATYGPGSVLEFVATFANTHSQHAGFMNVSGGDLAAPWAMFSTGGSDPADLYARSNNGTDYAEPIIGGTSYLGAPHRYRIEWTATQVIYSIDGTVVATHNVAVGGTASLGVSDNQASTLSVDWLRIGPYSPTTCTFTSRVLDSETNGVKWQSVLSSVALPTGTSVSFSARASDVNPPTGSFTSAPGGALPPDTVIGRYVQYQVTLSTSDAAVTPAIQRVTMQGQTPTAVTLTNLSAQGNGLSSAPLLLAASLIGLGVISAALIKRRR